MTDNPKLRKNGLPDGRGHGAGSAVTRFQAGDGRPRPGRTKGARDERTEVEEVLAMTVEVTQGSRRRRANTRQAMLLLIRQKALAGDHRAIAYLDAKFAQYAPPAVDLNLTRPLLDEDVTILALGHARGVLPDRPCRRPCRCRLQPTVTARTSNEHAL